MFYHVVYLQIKLVNGISYWQISMKYSHYELFKMETNDRERKSLREK